jgi:hypothetical protein
MDQIKRIPSLENQVIKKNIIRKQRDDYSAPYG